MTASTQFQPITFNDFLAGYPFARKEDYDLIEAMVATLSTPRAYACMVRSTDDGEPGIAGVVRRLEPSFSDLRQQAVADDAARTRLHRLTRAAGAVVKAVMAANGTEKLRIDGAMPAELGYFARTGAMYRFR